jgi:hypothetical protein
MWGMKLGEKIKFLGRDAIVLVEKNHEVLVQIDRNSVKWIDKELIDKNEEVQN